MKPSKILDIPISKQRDLSHDVSGPFSGINFFLTGVSDFCLTDLSRSKRESTGTWDRIGHHHPFKCATAILNLLIYD